LNDHYVADLLHSVAESAIVKNVEIAKYVLQCYNVMKQTCNKSGNSQVQVQVPYPQVQLVITQY